MLKYNFNKTRVPLSEEQSWSIRNAAILTRLGFLRYYIKNPQIHHYDNLDTLSKLESHQFDALNMSDYLVVLITDAEDDFVCFIVHPANKITKAYSVEESWIGCSTEELYEVLCVKLLTS